MEPNAAIGHPWGGHPSGLEFPLKQMALCLLIAAFGNAFYHVSQKTLPAAANPMVLLMAVYGVAFLGAALAAPWFRAGSGSWAAQVFTWPVLGLGLSVLVIELGFLLAYRTGASLQWSGVAVNGVSALLLLLVALLLFREAFSPLRMAGLLLTLSGLALLTGNGQAG